MTDTTKVRITALKNIDRKFAVVFMGEKVAVAFGRDSGAKVGWGARLISGDIDSGGSRGNWFCRVFEGTIFELEVDTEFFTKNRNRIKNWDIEVIPEFSLTKERADKLKMMGDNLE